MFRLQTAAIFRKPQIHVSSTLVAPWRWLQFSAETYVSSTTDCAVSWEETLNARQYSILGKPF